MKSLRGIAPALAGLVMLGACSSAQTPGNSSAMADSSFAAVQARGAEVMGVDQYTSTHVFEDLPDGGRIVLDRDDPADSAGIATVRAHMRSIVLAFEAGDFTQPFQVHDQVVPGTEVMAARREFIQYQSSDRPRGGEVRITTTDPAALAAIHEFLAFQRLDHRAAGREGTDHSGMQHSRH